MSIFCPLSGANIGIPLLKTALTPTSVRVDSDLTLPEGVEKFRSGELAGEGLPCGVSFSTPQGKGEGEEIGSQPD